jgi:hypothetical protein
MIRVRTTRAGWLSAPLLAYALAIGCARGESKERPLPPGQQQAQAIQQTDSAAVRRFVQSFYDWYRPMSDADRADPLAVVLGSADRWLAAGLAAALRGADLGEFQRELSFDAFLWSQDPCARYDVASVTVAPNAFYVAVRPVCPAGSEGAKWQTKQPLVEVVRESGQWKIANVKYDRGDLKAELCSAARPDSARVSGATACR